MGWWEKNNCEGSIVDFFPSEKNSKKIEAAKAICRGCLVRIECLEENIDEEEGIFGGTTGTERSMIRVVLLTSKCTSLYDLYRTLNKTEEHETHTENDTQDIAKVPLSVSVPVLSLPKVQSVSGVPRIRFPAIA